MRENIDFLTEWAIWAHLDSKTDLELILLKGHLLLEIILNVTLKRNNIEDYNNYSFHTKIIALDKIDFEDNVRKDFIISSLKSINKLRNRLAHQIHFDIKSEDLDLWAINILENLKGTKYSKYTVRTKIVHSFSILSNNILDLRNSVNNRSPQC